MKKPMSAARRKRYSESMKRYWAKKRFAAQVNFESATDSAAHTISNLKLDPNKKNQQNHQSRRTVVIIGTDDSVSGLLIDGNHAEWVNVINAKERQ